jgi:hypothetical protein
VPALTLGKRPSPGLTRDSLRLEGLARIVEVERKVVTEFFLLGWHHSEFEINHLLILGAPIMLANHYHRS